MDTTTVPLNISQVRQGAEVLARTFKHAPDMRFFIGDESRMLAEKTLRFYRAIIRIGMRYGEVTTTSSLDGLAIWVSPENNNFTFGSMFRTGLVSSILAIGLRPAYRFMRSALYVEGLQLEATKRPRWILVFLGVEPSRQGKGIGGVLIQPVLDRADDSGIPCYVESADERNLSFYNRHGFEVVNRGQVPNGGPKVWVLVREPA